MKTLAIIVNYKVSSLALKAAFSVLSSDSLGPLEVFVVDNSECSSEAEKLRSALPSNVRLDVNTRNIGFGRACNAVFAETTADAVLLLNPDAYLLPNCLISLQQRLLASPKTAAVGPKIFWDDELRFLLPPSYPAWLGCLLKSLHGSDSHSLMSRFVSRLWRRHALKVWLADEPVQVASLSGGHVLIKREAIDQIGMFFDPRFFLYFEDTDLFVRLRHAGFRLLVEPSAHVVHGYDQSGRNELGQKRQWFAESQAQFETIHCQQWKHTMFLLLQHAQKLMLGQSAPFPVEERYRSPYRLMVPQTLRKSWLFEWSPNPNFLPAAGLLGTGSRMDFTEDCWSLLAPGTYYGRLGGANFPGRIMKYVTMHVEKTSPFNSQ